MFTLPTINRESVISVAKGALAAAIGAGITYIHQTVAALDVPSALFYMSVWSVVANILRKTVVSVLNVPEDSLPELPSGK